MTTRCRLVFYVYNEEVNPELVAFDTFNDGFIFLKDPSWDSWVVEQVGETPWDFDVIPNEVPLDKPFIIELIGTVTTHSDQSWDGDYDSWVEFHMEKFDYTTDEDIIKFFIEDEDIIK